MNLNHDHLVLEKFCELFMSVVVSMALLMSGIFGTMIMSQWIWHNKFSNQDEIQSLPVTSAKHQRRQLECLARNIYHEAKSEPYEGKVAVAQVTVNRSNHINFPNDICAVVYQRDKYFNKFICQFSWYCDRHIQFRPIHKAQYEESVIVAKQVLLEGFRLPKLTEALYFHADTVNPKWRKTKIIKIGRHIFYK